MLRRKEINTNGEREISGRKIKFLNVMTREGFTEK